jgi:L-ribulose-5-phosphate 4-epimerase
MSDAMIKGDYEERTGDLIVETFAAMSHKEIEMVLVACHGPFTWGSTPERAVKNSVLLEMIARVAFMTLQINPDTPRLKPSLLRKHYERKHGPNAYYGQR